MNSLEYSQIYGILMMLGNSYIEKIPNYIMDEIIKRMDKNNIPNFNINTINTMNISDNVEKFISYLSIKYWNLNV